MIITLCGTITHKADNYAVIEAFGVGYQVHMTGTALVQAHLGTEVQVWTHDLVREDTRELFGFFHEMEFRLFKKLLNVSGVGPKSALSVLSLGVVRDIEARIDRGDVEWLTSVPGIGKKTAQKIVLELKGKLVDMASGGEDELVGALVSLGYNREMARDAATASGAGAVEERLRVALRQLGRK